ncbi:diphthamide biosynthesis enzyme Dph2 [Candidatus Micrarchaeota archaeon]|nr:diphthamide biosynthesis enzyme Dph2 [Candidatus Micrarchaeota archaeon]
MKILLQFPEGLKQQALKFVEKYESQGHTIYLSSSRSFGGCDVAFEEADSIGAEKIVHFGHCKFPIHSFFQKRFSNIKVEYIEYEVPIKDEFLIEIVKYAEEKKFKKVGLILTVQHICILDSLIKKLSEKEIEVFVGKGAKTVYPGQVLGCDTSSILSFIDKVDSIIFIGGGRFHYLAIHKNLEPYKVPIVSANPYTLEIKEINEEIGQYVKQRKGLIAQASEAETFGIIVSTRAGQFAIETAESIKKKLNEKGKNAEILVSRTVDAEALQDFNLFDAYINTSCPRLADDWKTIGKPVVNSNEIEILFSFL